MSSRPESDPEPSALPLDPSSAVMSITLLGNPILRARCGEVTEFGKPLSDLVEGMFEALYATENGVGLSANQVGRRERLFVFDFHHGQAGHVVNPSVVAIGQELQGGDESCLSIPGLGLPTSRLIHCLVRGFDAHGEPVEYEGEGLAARCFQHELDHLDGKLYVDRHPVKVRKRIEAEAKELVWWGSEALDPRSDLYRLQSDGGQ
jgi:peptide deformylase